MAHAKQFVDALKRNAPGGEPQSVKQYWDRQRGEWLEDLGRFREQVAAWLQPAVDAGGVRLVTIEYSTTEPDLGTYLAPGLRIELIVDPPVVVELRPRGCRVAGLVETDGRRVTGASGRVDLERGADRRVLLRFRGDDGVAWVSFARGEKRELTEEIFFDLLAQVAGIDLDDD